MPDDIANLVLEHLRHIRGRLDQLGDDMQMLKQRMTSFDLRQAEMAKSLVHVQADIAELHQRFDKTDARLERIERRLELAGSNP